MGGSQAIATRALRSVTLTNMIVLKISGPDRDPNSRALLVRTTKEGPLIYLETARYLGIIYLK